MSRSRTPAAARCPSPRTLALAVAATLLFAAHAAAQSTAPQHPAPIHVGNSFPSGPRFGFSVISRREVDTLAALGKGLGREVLQVGWEFEESLPMLVFFGPNARLTLLAGGLDRGEFLWSASGLIGFRFPSGVGFAVGPQIVPESVGFEALVDRIMIVRRQVITNSLRYSSTANGPRVTFLLGFSID